MPDSPAPARARIDALLADLACESATLDELVRDLDDTSWRSATPAPGWSIAHQIAHLAWTDRIAVLAGTDPDAFAAELSRARLDTVDVAAAEGATQPRNRLLATWRAGREHLTQMLRELPGGARIAWFGPPMGAASMATARLMETWAHGQDVADALGVTRSASDRLRHVAHIGVRTRDFAFALNDRDRPSEEFRVELTAPSGDVWTWGSADAAQRVSGPALDFCLLVTRRRHRDDLEVVAQGPAADAWLDIAQAFAGPPGAGRARMGARG